MDATIAQNVNKISQCLIIATHPRSGTHFTIDLLRKQFREFQGRIRFAETLHHSYLDLDHLMRVNQPYVSESQAIDLLSRPSIPLVKTHSLPLTIKHGAENSPVTKQIQHTANIYYIVRDGRDVLCSVYRWKNAQCSLAEFIRQQENGMSRPKQWANHVLSWLNESKVHLRRFEDICHTPNTFLEEIAREYNISPLWIDPLFPRRRQTDSRWEDYCLRLTRRLESTTIVGRHQGKPPKWQQALTCEDRAFFHQEAGQVLMQLDYESSEDWVDRV